MSGRELCSLCGVRTEPCKRAARGEPCPYQRCYVTDGYAALFSGTRAECEAWRADAGVEHRNAGSIPPFYRIFPLRE